MTTAAVTLFGSGISSSLYHSMWRNVFSCPYSFIRRVFNCRVVKLDSRHSLALMRVRFLSNQIENDVWTNKLWAVTHPQVHIIPSGLYSSLPAFIPASLRFVFFNFFIRGNEGDTRKAICYSQWIYSVAHWYSMVKRQSWNSAKTIRQTPLDIWFMRNNRSIGWQQSQFTDCRKW